jgi:CubicO group peptidase (beta-lactamase class C family)
MGGTAFLRSDELPGRVALGYLEVDGAWRTNVFHLPVRGSGDGGIYSTAADIRALGTALYAGRIVPLARVAELTLPRCVPPGNASRYGLGFWLHGTSDSSCWRNGRGVSFARARPGARRDAHGDLEHDGRRLAARALSAEACSRRNGRCGTSSPLGAAPPMLEDPATFRLQLARRRAVDLMERQRRRRA